MSHASVSSGRIRLPRRRTVALIAGFAVAAVASGYALGGTSRGDGMALASTTTTTLHSSVDTYVSSAYPNNSYGAATTLHVGSSPAQDALLRFSIPAVGTIQSATLRLRNVSGATGGVQVHLTGGSWSGTTTYNTRPSLGSLVAYSNPYTADTWVNISITSAVKPSATLNLEIVTTGGLTAFSSNQGSYPEQLVIVSSGTTATPTPAPSRSPSPSATPTPTPGTCTVSATLVNPCRAWLGAAVRGYPQVASDDKSQVLYHEQRIGRQLDVVHTYHPVGDNHLSADDIYFATRAGTYLYANWKPAGKWADIASNNAGIDQMASSIKSIAPKKLFLTIWHEPENDVTYDPNCPGVNYKGSAGTPTDYRNMWAYVHSRFASDGVTNVVYVMNYMNYKPWQCLIRDMWPGNNLVDWVAFEAYGGSESFDTKVGDFYNLLLADNDATHDFTSKPWAIGEWGVCANVAQSTVYSYYDQAKTALDTGTFPRLKMLMVYDDNGNNAGMGCLTEYTYSGNLDPTEQQHYNAFADDRKV